MTSVPVGEFKDNASKFIAAAEAGEDIVITRHGKAAVRLSAVTPTVAERSFDELWDMLMVQRERMRAEGRTSTNAERIAWKNEGRR